MKETLPLFPLLLNSENPQDDLTYKTVPVRAYQILDILKGNIKHLSFPFTINFYTSYHFVKETSLEIDRNMIGQLLREDTSDVLYVFLTPDIEKICVKINALNTIKNSIKFDKHNLFANTKITEGDKTVFYRTPNENILNQNSCICDHEDTQTFSPPKRYQHLVTGQTFKFLLYENLDSLGMLDESLKTRLRICSEISFLSYDTEALNKHRLHVEDPDDLLFVNKFTDSSHKKIALGIQQLYIMGLYDAFPIQATMDIFEKYLLIGVDKHYFLHDL